MQVKIESKKPNALFNRMDVAAVVSEFQSTPSRQDVAQALCKELDCTADKLVIQQIDQPFGAKQVKVAARVYDSPDSAKKFDRAFYSARGKSKAAEQPQPAVEEKAETKPEAGKAPEQKPAEASA